MTMQRRDLLAAVAAALAIAVGPPAAAQGEKPIRIIVGFPAGAAVDTLARMIADKMRLSLNQLVIVANRAGAGGRLATEFVRAQAPRNDAARDAARADGHQPAFPQGPALRRVPRFRPGVARGELP